MGLQLELMRPDIVTVVRLYATLTAGDHVIGPANSTLTFYTEVATQYVVILGKVLSYFFFYH